MKAKAKIFSVAISLALALVMTVLSTFAAPIIDISDSEKGITKISSKSQWDFEGTSIHRYVNKGVIEGTATNQIPGETGLKTSSAGHVQSKLNGNNTYLSFWHDTDEGVAKGSYWDIIFLRNAGKDEPTNFLFNDFITIDFDLCSDSYIGADGSLSTTGEKLAYPIVNFAPASRFVGADYSKNGSNSACSLVYEEGKGWFITFMGGKAPLSGTAGEWNHVTMIYDIDNSVDYSDGTTGAYDPARASEVTGLHLTKTKLYVYLNGQLVGVENEMFSSNRHDLDNIKTYLDNNSTLGGLCPYNIRFQPDFDKDFSLCFDNVSCNAFKLGYEGDLANHDLTQPLYYCDDVVFNSNYDFSAPNTPIATVNGANYYYEETLFMALDKLSESGEETTVTLNKSIEAVYEVKHPMTVITGGYTFNTTSEDFGRNESDGIIIFEEGSKATVTWDEGGRFESYSYCVLGAVPKYEGPTIIFDEDEGCMYKLIGWSDEEDGDPIELTAIEEINDYFFYAVYEVVDGAYTVETEEGTEAYEDFEKFEEVLSALSEDNTVTLYTSNPTPVNVTRPLTVIAGDSTFTYYSETYVGKADGDKIVFTEATESDLATVNWLNSDGKVLDTKKLTVGSSFIRDGKGVDPLSSDNRWYDYGFTGWESFSITEATVYNVKPIMSDPTPVTEVDGIKYNLGLTGKFTLYVYVPKDFPTLGDEVSSFTFSADSKNYKAANYKVPADPYGAWKNWNAVDCTIDGKQYIKFSLGSPTPYTVGAEYIDLTFSVNGKTSVVKVNNISIPGYLELASKTVEGYAEKRLVANTARYCNEVYKLKNSSDSYETYDNILADMSEYLIDNSYQALSGTFDASEKGVNYATTLAPYLVGASYEVTYSPPSFCFFIDEAKYQFVSGSLTYFNSQTGKNAALTLQLKSGSKSEICRVEVPAPYITQAVTVKLVLAPKDGSENITVTGTYSLAEYITASENKGVDTAAARALYAYSLASLYYKISD